MCNAMLDYANNLCSGISPSTHCLHCIQDNYFRPKGGHTCSPCACFQLGALSRSCAPQTGQCQCRTGVIGRQCNRCDNPYAEVTSSGCMGEWKTPCPSFMRSLNAFC